MKLNIEEIRKKYFTKVSVSSLAPEDISTTVLELTYEIERLQRVALCASELSNAITNLRDRTYEYYKTQSADWCQQCENYYAYGCEKHTPTKV